MYLYDLKNIVKVDRCILIIGKKELQYRSYELPEMFGKFGKCEIKTIQSFKSQDNAIEIILEPSI